MAGLRAGAAVLPMQYSTRTVHVSSNDGHCTAAIPIDRNQIIMHADDDDTQPMF